MLPWFYFLTRLAGRTELCDGLSRGEARPSTLRTPRLAPAGFNPYRKFLRLGRVSRTKKSSTYRPGRTRLRGLIR